MEIDIKVGQVIRALRERRGIDFIDFAARVGMEKGTLSKKERGQSPISLAQLQKMAKELGTTAPKILEAAEGTIDAERAAWDAAYDHVTPELRSGILSIAREPESDSG